MNNDRQEKVSGGSGISWHTAFFEAIRMELGEYHHALEFLQEYQLATEPLRIDLVIVRKTSDIPITKNIAAMFRKDNIIEYKSPGDYVSIKDFYHVYGYACLYMSLNNINIHELTLTFVESRYPRKLLAHLQTVRGFTVAENHPGIYTISGDILPIQIIDSRKLPVDDNIWLKALGNKLDVPSIRRIMGEIHRQEKDARIGVYLNVIAKANKALFEEALDMHDIIASLDKTFTEIGVAAKWEARAEERKTIAIAQNMVTMGLPFETIVAATKLDPVKIQSLYEVSV